MRERIFIGAVLIMVLSLTVFFATVLYAVWADEPGDTALKMATTSFIVFWVSRAVVVVSEDDQ